MKSEKIPEAGSVLQQPLIDLKMEHLIKIVNNFKQQAIFTKSSISGVSRILSSPLAAINQTFLTSNKTAISLFSGMVALTTQSGFCLFKVIKGNSENTRVRREMCLKSATEDTRMTSVILFCCFYCEFEHISHIVLVFLLLILSR